MTKNTPTSIYLETNLSEKITLIAAELHCRPNDLINEAVRLFVEGQERIKQLKAEDVKRQSLLSREQKKLEEEWEKNQDYTDWI
ncbi:hypothetical protein N7281_03600 [Rickettsia hoogstraalii]|uniref:CopG family transcriptional regulator n=1 Tax=Rickettsia asembonensis TaxID=1068590 RepID=A0A0C2RE68_9RICK|nr:MULTISPECIES: hypothetical protein [spotted fever group]KIJ89110.1 hypothetical protein SB78_01340 [Rickettsia asembonensis]MCX4083951.1 hypothetical protein [Rickettsia hoogstraalii]HJD57821.1 hypothetical protein [Rickettsia endosymbiont of Ceroptres masudai]